MEEFIGIVFAILFVVSIVMYPKSVLKFIGFFIVGFMVGLKGINPLKWFD